MRPMARALLLVLAMATPALAQNVVRVGDPTSHGGVIVGPGVPTVNIEGQPAAVLGDFASCPLSTGFVPHVGGPIVTGSTTVLIGGKPAARAGDVNAENGGAAATMIVGAPTVIIGP